MRKRFLFSLCLCGLTSGIWTTAQIAMPPHRRLLDNARIVVRHQWQAVDGTSFQWASHRHLLIVPYQMAQPIKQRDVLTGRETLLPQLTQRLRHAPGGSLLHWSPDPAHWSLSITRSPSENSPVLYAFTLDGKQQISWSLPKSFRPAQFYWMHDNRHWLALQEDSSTGNYTRVLLGDRLDPKMLQDMVLPADSPFNQLNHSIGCVVSPERILSVPGRFYQVYRPQGRSLTLYEIRIHGKTVTTKQHQVILPKGAGLREVAFSADGRQIAWRLRSVYRPPYATLPPARIPAALKEAATWKEGAARAVNSIWLSDGQGRNLREIGFIDVPLRQSDLNPAVDEPRWTDGGTDEPGRLQWLPDGKSLSLWIENEMYRIEKF